MLVGVSYDLKRIASQAQSRLRRSMGGDEQEQKQEDEVEAVKEVKLDTSEGDIVMCVLPAWLEACRSLMWQVPGNRAHLRPRLSAAHPSVVCCAIPQLL